MGADGSRENSALDFPSATTTSREALSLILTRASDLSLETAVSIREFTLRRQTVYISAR